jgi:hypothetical protein
MTGGDRMYAEVYGLQMTPDSDLPYSINVRAKNAAGMESDDVKAIFRIDNKQPTMIVNGEDSTCIMFSLV